MAYGLRWVFMVIQLRLLRNGGACFAAWASMVTYGWCAELFSSMTYQHDGFVQWYHEQKYRQKLMTHLSSHQVRCTSYHNGKHETLILSSNSFCVPSTSSSCFAERSQAWEPSPRPEGEGWQWFVHPHWQQTRPRRAKWTFDRHQARCCTHHSKAKTVLYQRQVIDEALYSSHSCGLRVPATSPVRTLTPPTDRQTIAKGFWNEKVLESYTSIHRELCIELWGSTIRHLRCIRSGTAILP